MRTTSPTMPAILRRAIALALVVMTAGVASPAGAQQRAPGRVDPTGPGETALWREMLTKLDAGATVAVRLKDGTRTTGSVLQVSDEAFTFKARTRIPVPARDVAFADVATIERQKIGMSPGKKVLLGVGIGAAVYFVSMITLLAASD